MENDLNLLKMKLHSLKSCSLAWAILATVVAFFTILLSILALSRLFGPFLIVILFFEAISGIPMFVLSIVCTVQCSTIKNMCFLITKDDEQMRMYTDSELGSCFMYAIIGIFILPIIFSWLLYVKLKSVELKVNNIQDFPNVNN